MAKSNKKQQVQLLSPENYIRLKARNLPIHECWLNSDWEKVGVAQIVISRIHANGNLTFGTYMVDLLCKGIRDSYYEFNSSTNGYYDVINIIKGRYDIIRVEYSLVHNIILAGVEYAAELGFEPHKFFTAVTQYILDEDTNAIELIEIECGRNGKPLFIQSISATDEEVQKDIKQLEKTVGKGNFEVLMEKDMEHLKQKNQTKDINMHFEFEDECVNMNAKERRKLFLKLSNTKKDANWEEELDKLTILTDTIFTMDICDEDIVDNLLESWSDEFEMQISDEKYTPESLGASPDSVITEKDNAQFNEMYVMIEKNPKKGDQLLDELRKKWGYIPYICYMKLRYLETQKPEEFISKLREYCILFPNYSLLKLYLYVSNITQLEDKTKAILVAFKDVFADRSSITNFEMYDFQSKKFIGILARKNLNELEAIYHAIDDLQLSEIYLEYFKSVLLFSRTNSLKDYYNSTLLK